MVICLSNINAFIYYYFQELVEKDEVHENELIKLDSRVRKILAGKGIHIYTYSLICYYIDISISNYIFFCKFNLSKNIFSFIWT